MTEVLRGSIYKTHKNYNVNFGDGYTLDDCRELAEIAAKQGTDGLYRFFAPTFITAFSSLNGVVVEHKDVTIPLAHW